MYNDSTNVLQTLVESSIDMIISLGKQSIPFWKWLFDGYIQEKIDFDILWKELKIRNTIGNYPILYKENKGNFSNTWLFTVPIGLSINDFILHRVNIAQFLKCNIKDMRIELINGMVGITVYNTSKLSFDYKDYKFSYTREVRVPLGISLTNFSTIYWQPTSPTECHMLIGGSTGSGKSVTLNVILDYLSNRKDVELYLQDTKRIDLVQWEKKAIQYNEGKDYADETSALLVDIMNNRYRELKEDRNKKFKHIFYVVEELASFNPKEDKDFYSNLSELLAKGRASSIYVILTTQAPYSDILPGVMKNNVNSIIGLKTRTGEASKVIIGEHDLLVNLRGKGHAIFSANGEYQEIQVFNI